MVSNLFEQLVGELTGLDVGEVKIGTPHEPTGLGGILDGGLTVYLTYLSLESIDRVRRIAKVRIMITTYFPESDAGDEEVQKEALEGLDDIIRYLADNQRQFTLIATPDHSANNIWSSLRIPLRPFLVYECPITLTE